MKRKKEIVNGVIGVVVFFTVRAAVARGVTGVVVLVSKVVGVQTASAGSVVRWTAG